MSTEEIIGVVGIWACMIPAAIVIGYVFSRTRKGRKP